MKPASNRGGDWTWVRVWWAPQVLFLDEPTTGLDPRGRLEMWDVIRELVTEGITLLLTTQYLEEADRLADTIAVIDGGKVIAEGTSDELKSRVGGEVLALCASPTAAARRTRRAPCWVSDPAAATWTTTPARSTCRSARTGRRS